MRITILIIALFGTLAATYAQGFSDDEKKKVEQIKALLLDEDRDRVDGALVSMVQAGEQLSAAEAEDAPLADAFKKGSTPKAEKKALSAKIKRVNAGIMYEEAYTALYETMSKKIKRMPFLFPDDKLKAKELREQAGDKVQEATTRGDDYKYLEDIDLETYPYASLKSAVSDGSDMFKSAMSMMFEAYDLQFQQESKRAAMGEEAYQWLIAEHANTFTSYKTYCTSLEAPKNKEVAFERMEQLDPVRWEAEKAELMNASPAPVAATDTKPAQPNTATASAEKPKKQTEPKIKPKPEPKQEPQVVVREEVPVISDLRPSNPVEDAPSSKQQFEGTSFYLQFVAVRRPITVEEAKKLCKRKDVVVMEDAGMYKCLIGKFPNYMAAKSVQAELPISTFVVAIKDGTRLPVSEVMK